MTRIITYLAALVTTLLVTNTAAAANHRPEIRCSSTEPAKAELACGRHNLHLNSSKVRWIRNHAGNVILLSATHARHSLGYYLWRVRVDKGFIAQASHRLHPPHPADPAGLPPHAALWECIHEHEGPWNDTSLPYTGGLQMHEGWYGLANAGYVSKAQQEWTAEHAYASQHYSSSFLYQQWFNWDGAAGVCMRFAG